jgi:hypothetical protein
MKISFPVLAIVLALFVRMPNANADKVARPRSYRQVTSDGKFVFVMLAPHGFEENAVVRDPEDIRAIRERYKQSGLYRNDGSDTPIWTVDWYQHEGAVELAPDNEHLIRTHASPSYDRTDPPSSRYRRVVLSFFDRGKLLRSYRVDELIADPWLLPHSVSHFQWLDRKAFDESTMRYTVWTQEGSWFEFDVASGQILEQLRVIPPSTSKVLRVALIAFALFSIATCFVWWKRRQPVS